MWWVALGVERKEVGKVVRLCFRLPSLDLSMPSYPAISPYPLPNKKKTIFVSKRSGRKIVRQAKHKLPSPIGSFFPRGGHPNPAITRS
jgi:hypothetical protein